MFKTPSEAVIFRFADSKDQAMGSFFATQLAVKQMQKQKTPGSVVMIASITSHVNLPGYRMAGYNMSKGGVRMVAKALSAELAPSGIRVNSVSPAFIETNQTRTAREGTTAEAGDLMNTAPPIGRIGSAYEVSPAVVFLLSDAASYTTGSDILVSGGIHTGRGGDYDMC
jgi:sorbose reductase